MPASPYREVQPGLLTTRTHNSQPEFQPSTHPTARQLPTPSRQAQREATASELRAAAQAASRTGAELGAALDAAERQQADDLGRLDKCEEESRALDTKAKEYIQRITATQEKLQMLGYRKEVSGPWAISRRR
jgi:hypothetical protein